MTLRFRSAARIKYRLVPFLRPRDDRWPLRVVSVRLPRRSPCCPRRPKARGCSLSQSPRISRVGSGARSSSGHPIPVPESSRCPICSSGTIVGTSRTRRTRRTWSLPEASTASLTAWRAHGALLDSIASATSLLRGEDCRRGGGPVCLCIRPGGKVESRYPTGGFGADDVGS